MNLIYSPESNYSLLYILWDMLSWRALVIIAMLAIVNWLYDNRFKMAIPKSLVLMLVFLYGTLGLFYSFGDGLNDYRERHVNYKSYDNYDRIEHISGRLKKVVRVEEEWPGNVFETSKPKRLWTVFYVHIGGDVIKLRDLNWKVNREFGMPPCYSGDFGELLQPHVGENIDIGYYKTITTSHKSDNAICLVDAYKI